MPDLNFEIISAGVRQFAVTPTLVFDLQITNELEGEEIYAAGLKCQVMIEAIRRQYDDETKERLYELFGEPNRWGQTLKTLFWTIINVPVPRFTGTTVIEISIPCSEDQAMAAGKYFSAVKDEKIPLLFLFSGTLFYKTPQSALQVTLVSWEKEASYKMRAGLWQEMMDIYFPGCRWLRVKKDVYERLLKYKASSTFPTVENCLDYLLDEALSATQAFEK